MNARENDELQQAKTFVLNWQQSIDSATEDGLLAGFSEYMADNYLWRSTVSYTHLTLPTMWYV